MFTPCLSTRALAVFTAVHGGVRPNEAALHFAAADRSAARSRRRSGGPWQLADQSRTRAGKGQSRGRAQRLARAGHSGRRSENAEGQADIAPGWRILRCRLLARRPSPLRLRRQHGPTLRLRMERRRGHSREQVRTGEGKDSGRHRHQLSGGNGVLFQREIPLCRRECRRSARGGGRRDRRDQATVSYRSLSLWRRAHDGRSGVRLGLGREHGVAVPRFGGRNARVPRQDRSWPASVGASGEGNDALRHARG